MSEARAFAQPSSWAHPLADDLEHIHLHGSELWESLRKARIFVTGGTGFFGKWLLESLAWINRRRSLGLQAVVLTRRPGAFCAEAPHLGEDNAIELVEGDVRTFAFPGGNFTHVVHAATPVAAQLLPNEPAALLDIIISGTQRVLEFARAARAQRVLLVSSGAVYGRQPAGLHLLDEDYRGAPDACNVQASYGLGKRLAEHLGVLYQDRHTLHVTIARGFAFVGPHLPLDAHFAIGNFLRDGLMGGPIRVAGDGTTCRSYLYAADLAVWLWTILLRGQPCRPYNVGSEQEISIAALAHKIASCFGCDVRIASSAEPARTSERYLPSTHRARTELGLQAWTDLDESIDRTVCYLRHRSCAPEGVT
jgi:dTDP-glucose 4,6-dehydratase